MQQKRWQRIVDLFGHACEIDGLERETYLSQECCDDPDMLSEIQELLSCHESPVDERFELVPTFVARSQTADSVMIGKTLGPYRITKLIGRGGFSDVFQAKRCSEFEQVVAVKILRGEHTLSPTEYQRFEIERQILADLNHKNIAKVLDAGRDEWGRPYLIMEAISNGSLITYCDERQLGVRERVELFRQICEGVGHAHSLGIVHRDVKPNNLLVDEHDVPKLVDFGIAKLTHLRSNEDALQLTRTGLIPMTPHYASPEQIRGEPVGLASDVYSLGVVLYELLTGRRPYRLTTMSPQHIERTVCLQNPTRPSDFHRSLRVKESEHDGASDGESSASTADICTNRSTNQDKLRRTLRGLDKVILMALRKEPERRYRSAEEFAEDLTRYLNGAPVVAGNESWTYRFRSTLRRNATPIIAAGLVLLSLIVGLIASATAWQSQKSLALDLRSQIYGQDMELAYQAIGKRDFQLAQDIFERNRDVSTDKQIEWSVLERLSRLPKPQTLGAHDGGAYEIAIVPHKPWAVSVGADDQIIVWDTEAGKRVHTIFSQGPFASVAVSHDGRYLAVGQDTKDVPGDDVQSSVGLWDLRTFKFVQTVVCCAASPEALAFSPDSKQLAVGPRYEPLLIVEVPTGQLLHKLEPGEAEAGPKKFPRYWQLNFLNDGSLLSPARIVAKDRSKRHTLELWGKDQSGRIRSFRHREQITSFDVAAEASLLVATDEYRSYVGFLDLETGSLLGEATVPFGRKCLAISNDGDHLTIGFDDGTLLHGRLSVSTTKNEDQLPNGDAVPLRLKDRLTFQAHDKGVRFATYTRAGRLMTCGDDGAVRLWQTELTPELDNFPAPVEGLSRFRVGHNGNLEIYSGSSISVRDSDGWKEVHTGSKTWLSSRCSSDGNFLVFGGHHGELQIADMDDPAKVLQSFAHGNKGVHDVEWSPNDRLVAAIGNNEFTTVWDVASGKRLHKLPHNAEGTFVRFSPTGELLACGGKFECIEVYDVSSGEVQFSFPRNSPVESISWSPNERFLATVHLNGEVRLHELKDSPSTDVLCRHQTLSTCVLFLGNDRLVSGSGDASIRFWHIPTKRRLGRISFDSLLDEPEANVNVGGLGNSPDGKKLEVLVNRTQGSYVFELPLILEHLSSPY